MFLLCGCAAPKPPPVDKGPDWQPMGAGRSCARAKVACGHGNCAARISNECSTALTCELTVQSLCRAFTGESGEAIARKTETIPGGEPGGVLAQVICNDGEVLTTRALQLQCD